MVVRLIDFGAATIEGKQEHREDGVTINYLFASVQRSLFPSNGEILHITNLIALLILFIQAFRTFISAACVTVFNPFIASTNRSFISCGNSRKVINFQGTSQMV